MRDRVTRGWGLAALLLLLLLLVGTASAQYKVVGPDGRITYTDRPPAAAATRLPGTARAAGAAAEPVSADLPFDLRQAMARYPATLYTAPNCGPCDSARGLLRQRGVPVREFSLVRAEDLAELQRREGTLELPLLRLGAQRLQGFEAGDWHATLDAATYPRTSRLPPGWRATPAQPLVPAAGEPDTVPAVAPGTAPPATPVLPAASGQFRF